MFQSSINSSSLFIGKIFQAVQNKIHNQFEVGFCVVKKLVEIASFLESQSHLNPSLIHEPQCCVEFLQDSIERLRVPLLNFKRMGHVSICGFDFPPESVEVIDFFISKTGSLKIRSKQCHFSASGIHYFDQMNETPFKLKTEVSF